MRLGYNTNGFAHHDLLQALDLLAEIGYRSAAITVDHHALNPFDPACAEQAARVAGCLQRNGMSSVIETGCRYLLDPRHKHEPTLMTADPRARAQRIDFLRAAIDIAAELGSECVSLWSGMLREAIPEEAALERLGAGLRVVLAHAASRKVPIGFEPEPGMFIDTMHRFERLCEYLDGVPLGLTLDIGHLHCQGELPLAAQIRTWGPRLLNVHIEDMRAGVHEHLMFGEGEIEFPPVIEALRASGFRGGLHVELSRHSHAAPAAARQAYGFLAPLLGLPGSLQGSDEAAAGL